MRNELIKINPETQAVSARELYEFLDAKAKFIDWCKRMFEYGFDEGKDFITILGKSTGGRPSIDYALTLDTAKEIAMLQRSEKGKQARQYFIEVEKKYKTLTPQYTLPTTFKEALLQLVERVEQNERLETQVKELAPKAEYTDKVLQSVSDWTTTIIAKELGMSAQKLNAELYKLGIQYFQSGSWMLYAKYDDKGYTETRTYVYSSKNGDVKTNIYTVWTEKGRAFIHSMLNQKILTNGLLLDL